MARVGAGEVSELSPDRALLAMAFGAIALRIVGNASAHGGWLNAEGCYHDRKHGGYHCHRGGAALSRSDLMLGNGFAPAQVARALQSSGVFSNCAEARAVGAGPITYSGLLTSLKLNLTPFAAVPGTVGTLRLSVRVRIGCVAPAGWIG